MPDTIPRGQRSASAPYRRRFDRDRAPAYDSPFVMADYIIERRLWLPRPRPDVFDFFADPRNLSAVQPRVMVREFDPPFRFVDVQLWGPFARWEHRHRFLAGPFTAGPGPVGTWMEDRVTYRLPWGPLGKAAHALGVGRRLATLFEFREARLRERFA